MKNEETRPDPILNQTFLKQIPNFPSIVVGRESGFGENKLFNLLDDTLFKQMDRYHTELKYDIAVAL